MTKRQFIVVPDITFVSTAAAVQQAGHSLCLAPVNEQDLCLDLDWFERCIPALNPRAVIPVHYSGNCCDMDRLVALCLKHDIKIIEDCAHACGSKFRGQSLGLLGDLGCYSFHAVKNLPIGDGGMVVGNARYEQYLRKMRWMGIDKSTFERSGKTYSFDYDIEELGWKYHGNDIGAVIGLHGLDLLDQHNRRRKEIFDRYSAALEGIVPVNQGVESSHHLVCIKIKNRDQFIDFMQQRGVSIGVHYKPLSSFRAFRWNTDHDTRTRGMELFRQIATLPCYPDLTDDQQQYIIGLVQEFLHR